MNRCIDGQPDEWTDRQTDRQMIRHIIFQAFIIQRADSFSLLSYIVVIFHGQKMDEEIDVNKQMNRCIDGQTDEWTDRQMIRHIIFQAFIIQRADSFSLLSYIVVIFHGQKMDEEIDVNKQMNRWIDVQIN